MKNFKVLMMVVAAVVVIFSIFASHTMAQECPDVYFVDKPLPPAFRGVNYQELVSANVKPPNEYIDLGERQAAFTLTYSLVSGSLPRNLTLDAYGYIKGIPVAPLDNYSFGIKVQNGCGKYAQKVFFLTVSEPFRKVIQQNILDTFRKVSVPTGNLKNAKDELQDAYTRLDKSITIYLTSLEYYNNQISLCGNKDYTPNDRKAAGCTESDTPVQCDNKLIKACLGHDIKRLDFARKTLQKDSANFMAKATGLDNIIKILH